MTSTPAPVDLEELRAVAEKATKGPWEAVWGTEYGEMMSVLIHYPEGVREKNGLLWVARFDDDYGTDQGANGEFIATFDPPTVLALLSEIESLRSDNGQLAADVSAERLRGRELTFSLEEEVASLRSDRERLEKELELGASIVATEAHLTHLERIADAARALLGVSRSVAELGGLGATELTKASDALAAALNQEAPDVG